MKVVELLHGPSTCGKTTYLRQADKQGLHAINLDRYYDQDDNITRLIDKIRLCEGHIVIDGYPYWVDKNFEEIKKYASLRHGIFLVPNRILSHRQKLKGTFKGEEEIFWTYDLLLNQFSEKEFKDVMFFHKEDILFFESKERAIAFINLMNVLPNEEAEKQFFEDYSKAQLQSGDKIYQTYASIDLPSYSIKGDTPCEKTFSFIAKNTDLKNKSVVEFGCHYGYLLHKCLENNARSALGLEANPDTIQVAERIAWLKQSAAEFKHYWLGREDFKKKRNITICTNMLHYVPANELEFALKTIFSNTSEVFFEVKKEQEKIVRIVGEENGFILTAGEKSDREERVLLYFR